MTPENAKALREPFPPALIGKIPKGGVQLDYVGHAATTDRLLQVDPLWTWEPFALDAQGAPLIANGGLWIKLTVCGVTRPGFGDGKNQKEMIGDAIRNAAMRFGVALDLWAKEDLHASDEPPAVAKPSAPPKAALPKAAPGTDALMKELVALSLEYKVCQPDFDPSVIRTKAAEKVGKDGYEQWLIKQIELLKGHIAEKKAAAGAEASFPIPAGAKAA